jgi:polysaccharide deacetylase family protein (PEP-CTERM system associated)
MNSLQVYKRHLLTVALEDYFQVGAFNKLIQRGQWYRFETRLEHNTLEALNLLDRFNVKATFFILGWIADQFPEIVRTVADRGHEIASKGYYHRSIRQMAPSEFKEDLFRSREALERAGRTKVLGYRVAHEWFMPSDLWALDVLAEEGYAYDSSISPMFRRFAHEPYRRFAHKHVAGTNQLWEFPLSTWSFLGWQIPIAGGNYFRQFPHAFVKQAVDQWHQTYDVPFVMYFHVWELDPGQPHISAISPLTRIRHYRNLEKMSWVLADYLTKYRFTGMADFLRLSTDLDATQSCRMKAEQKDLPRQIIHIALDKTSKPPVPGTSAQQITKVSASVVVPCFNEELVLPYLANTLANFESALQEEYNLQFIFVDDCSLDATWNALRHIFGSRPNCVVLRHEKNQGAAAAILTGIRHASTEIVCSIDCDCTYDPLELRNMIPMLSDGVDVVTASPYHPEGGVRNVPPWRLSLSKGASFLYRRVLRQKLSTYTSFFRVHRKSAVVDLKLRESGFLGVAEMLGLLDLRGSTIVEYPTVLEVRMLGRSKMKIIRNIAGHLRLLARLVTLRLLHKNVSRAVSHQRDPELATSQDLAASPITTRALPDPSDHRG